MIQENFPSKREIAKILTEVEVAFNLYDLPASVCALLDRASQKKIGKIIGLSGAPGAGKSALSAKLCDLILLSGKAAAVVAVDPSSQFSGGAILGDRVRFTRTETGDQLFFRSLSSGDCFGGLARSVFGMVTYLASLFDYVFVETVGVGQTEIDVRRLSDVTVFCVQPGAGDIMQFMKAGVMETPDIFAITKADFGAVADKARAELRSALGLRLQTGSEKTVLKVSAETGEALSDLLEKIENFSALVTDEQNDRDYFFRKMMIELYGKFGMTHYKPNAFRDEPIFTQFQAQLECFREKVRYGD